MSAAWQRLLELLAVDGERADGLAIAICGLIVEGGKLGELEIYQVVDPAQESGFRECRGIPRLWLERLVRAAEVGAFERLPAKAIVERILTPPAEDAKT